MVTCEADVWTGFSDKFFVYQFAVVLLGGCAWIDQYFNGNLVCRYDTREKLVRDHLILYIAHDFLMVSIVFLLFNIEVLALRHCSFACELSVIADNYFRFLLGAVLMSELVLVFRYANLPFLKMSPQIAVFLVLLAEVMLLVPKVRDITGFSFGFIFSWIFDGRLWDHACLLGLIIIGNRIIFRECKRCDFIF